MSKEVITLDGYEIGLKNLNKILFPQSGITKKDVINYYKDIAKIALPYYRNRPLTMQRCPNGILQQNFIQKNIPLYFPKWIDRWELPKKDGKVEYILANKPATLVYLANQACITCHLGLSEVNKINYPRYLLFDLDPSDENVALLKLVAKKIKAFSIDLGLTPYIQTTGSRGFHIYIPLDRTSPFEEVHVFARTFATFLSQKYPQEITIEQRKEERRNRIFLDYARNSYGLHAVGSYSLRAKEKAPIATPLYWEELEDKKLHSQSYNIKNIINRLDNIQDPWKEIFDHPQSLKKAQTILSKLSKELGNSEI